MSSVLGEYALKLNCGIPYLVLGGGASRLEVFLVPAGPDSLDFRGFPYEAPSTGVSFSSGLLVILSDVLPVSDDSSESLDESSLEESSCVVFGGSLQQPPGLPQEPLLLIDPFRLLSD